MNKAMAAAQTRARCLVRSTNILQPARENISSIHNNSGHTRTLLGRPFPDRDSAAESALELFYRFNIHKPFIERIFRRPPRVNHA